jgi:hypothetical protein
LNTIHLDEKSRMRNRRQRRIFIIGIRWGQGGSDVPSMFNKNSMYNCLSLVVSLLIPFFLAISKIIWAANCSRIITWNFKDLELELNYKEPMIDTWRPIHESSVVMFEIVMFDLSSWLFDSWLYILLDVKNVLITSTH